MTNAEYFQLSAVRDELRAVTTERDNLRAGLEECLTLKLKRVDELTAERDKLRAFLLCLTTSPRFASMTVTQAMAELHDNGCVPSALHCPLAGDVHCLIAKEQYRL